MIIKKAFLNSTLCVIYSRTVWTISVSPWGLFEASQHTTRYWKIYGESEIKDLVANTLVYEGDKERHMDWTLHIRCITPRGISDKWPYDDRHSACLKLRLYPNPSSSQEPSWSTQGFVTQSNLHSSPLTNIGLSPIIFRRIIRKQW